MPVLPRDLPHLYLRGSGRPETYTSKLRPPKPPLPERDRNAHSESLRVALTSAIAGAAEQQLQRDPAIPQHLPGFYLDFEIVAGSEYAVELLENRRKRIELVTVRPSSETSGMIATVFVPDPAADHFLGKIIAYGTEDTSRGKPKNQELVSRIQNVSASYVRSLFTDDPERYPSPDEFVWWEVWIRQGGHESFDSAARMLMVSVSAATLVFPEREVRLVYGSDATIASLYLNSNAIAELRRAQDTPTVFVGLSNVDQAQWAGDLSGRLTAPENRNVSVCILDTGITRTHPLLNASLIPNDVHVVDPTWTAGDQHGHGTNMAGVALLGDLLPLLLSAAPVTLTHCLESVKFLPDQGENEPGLYGAVTSEAIARAEISAPDRRRVICMAVTSGLGANSGRPSSWSAAIDQLCFGDQTASRFILISAGNIREGLSKDLYPMRNEAEGVESPAQAWNALTVGAFTEKCEISDSDFAGWEPIAPSGDLCPTSRTSVSWTKSWPIKPEIVMEGGNWAALDGQCDCPDDLGILTTFRDPATRHFDVFRDTSASTAMAGNLAARIVAAMPQRWPESIRALMVHSAEWTTVMRDQFDGATSDLQKRALLRKYGYGVPSYERAVLSAANDLTLIAEDELRPFWSDGGVPKTCHMNLHQFPWPTAELEDLGASEVELRVTLSYFVEPNPGERGWLRRHRYSSHSLRFEVKRALESVEAFRMRINAAAVAEENGLAAINAGKDNWYLGRRVRNVGSIHSDYWRGTAAELSQRSAVGVYPVGGWWKENPSHGRINSDVRYALVVSVRATNGAVDIYNPTRVQIAVPVEIAV